MVESEASMDMLSRKDLIQRDWTLFENPETLQRLALPLDIEKQRYTFTTLSSS